MIKQKWMVQAKAADFQGLGKRLGVDPVTVRLLRNRGLTTEEEMRRFLEGGREALYDGSRMLGMEQAVTILLEKIERRKPIRIIGDYDIDGITATYILERTIRAMGGVVSHKIPHRITDGYGVNENLIRQAHEDKMDTILTCDNGIAAMEAIALGKRFGMTIVVTDHHSIPYEEENGKRRYLRSEADVIVNPKQEECTYPFPDICGAFVAFKLSEQLLLRSGLLEEERQSLWENLCMYAAIGTVGDIMELREENRAIVQLGLSLIHETTDESLLALIRACKLEKEAVNAYHIGFVLGPCLNASGRLKTAEMALDMLLHKEPEACRVLAEELVSLNEERKRLTKQQTEIAIGQVSREAANDKVLVVFLPDCHESIAGIIAGRVREYFYRPTMVVTRGEDGLKGSGRSIEGYSMFEEMTKVADCFTRFGGHPMAAGFSLEEEKLSELRTRLNENCCLTEEDLQEKVHIDAAMPMDYVTMPLVYEFSRLEPFGKGNEAPLFAQKNLEILHYMEVGRERKFVKLLLRTEYGNQFSGIYFEEAEKFKEFLKNKFGEDIGEKIISGKQTKAVISVCYVPEINSYHNTNTLQMRIKYVS